MEHARRAEPAAVLPGRPRETFVKLCTDSLRRFFGPNEYVFRAGDVGRELFFLSRDA